MAWLALYDNPSSNNDRSRLLNKYNQVAFGKERLLPNTAAKGFQNEQIHRHY
jgi:hypothetical protein